MSNKSLKDNPKTLKTSSDEIEDWNDFEEVDLDKKRYVSDASYEALRRVWETRHRHTKESITQIFRENFGDKFDYSKVDWDGVGTTDWWTKKITIICDVHGEFEQVPMSHKIGKGCRRCSAINRPKRQKNPTQLSQEEVIARFINIHGDKYDYSKVVYVKTSEHIIIICPEHGEFLQRPAFHLKGASCPKCASKKKQKEKQISSIQDFRKVHGDRYDYSKVEYVRNDLPVIIICPIHGEFEQLPQVHKRGSGCSKCRKSSK